MNTAKVSSCAILLLALSFPAPGFGPSEDYKVGKQDILRIEVPGEAEISREAVTVSAAGTISMPMIGELKIEGLSTIEIADLIRNVLIEQKILTQPSVSVTVREYRSQAVTILGEVRSTGKYFLKGPDKLLDKIAEAGGFSANAGDITVSRTSPAGNELIVIKSADLLRDMTLLKPGDVVLVKAKEIQQIFVSGEVVSGRPITFSENMTLSHAILMAGGVTRFASKSKITIKRVVDGEVVMLRANLANIEKNKDKDVPLLPGDTIVVGRRVF